MTLFARRLCRSCARARERNAFGIGRATPYPYDGACRVPTASTVPNTMLRSPDALPNEIEDAEAQIAAKAWAVCEAPSR